MVSHELATSKYKNTESLPPLSAKTLASLHLIRFSHDTRLSSARDALPTAPKARTVQISKKSGLDAPHQCMMACSECALEGHGDAKWLKQSNSFHLFHCSLLSAFSSEQMRDLEASLPNFRKSIRRLMDPRLPFCHSRA